MRKTTSKAPAAIACAIVLATTLAVPTAHASVGAYEYDVDDIAYVDEDEDGYDDNTDEWIGFGTAEAASTEGGPEAGGVGVSTTAASDAAASSSAVAARASASAVDADGSGTAGNSSGSAAAAGNGTGAGDAGNSGESGAKDASGNSASAKDADKKDDGSKDKDKPTSSAFTFAGTGTTVDNATSGDGVEFFTIKTDDDKVYYLVVDRNSGTDNVYLLNTVTGGDLEALAENGKINLGKPAVTQPAEAEKEEPEKEVPERQGAPEWLAYLLVVAVVGGGAFAYYTLKVKPEREESKVDEGEVRSFEADGIYPPTTFDQNGSWAR